ncbi:MAG: hypothetical protein NC548_21270 [Lachnospiraceae bacterium]|nr:hypothetical protein [Lachnospiraceae bacterium]
MEPKSIGVISNNLETVRKIAEKRIEETKKMLNEILNGDVIQGIVSAFLSKMDENQDEVVQLNREMVGVGMIMKKNNELLKNSDSNKDVVDILKDISATVKGILKKEAKSPATPDVEEVLKKIVGDVKKDEKAKTLLTAVLMGKDVIENLAAVKKKLNAAKKGVKALEEILFGGKESKGLIDILQKISEHKSEIEKGNKSIEHIAGTTKALAGIALMLIAMIVLAIPAMIGAVATMLFIKVVLLMNRMIKGEEKNIIQAAQAMTIMMGGLVLMGIAMLLMFLAVKNVEWEQIGMTLTTVAALSTIMIIIGKLNTSIIEGAAAFAIMSGALILMGISMMLMYKAVEKADWEQFGMICAALVAFGVIAALYGLAIEFVALGAVAMGILGIALISLAVGIFLFNVMVTPAAIDKVAEGLPRIIKAITSIFDTDKENPSFGDSIMGIVIGALKIGGAIFVAGMLILLGIALSFLAVSLLIWEHVDLKSIDNLEYAMDRINKIFHLEEGTEGGASLGGIADGVMGLITSSLRFGKTLFQMGTILLASVVMSLVYVALLPWKKFDRNSIDNFEYAYERIKEIFKIDDDSSKGPGALFEGIFDLACAALQFGATLFRMGTILIIAFSMDLVYVALLPWKDFDSSSIDNFEYAYERIKEIFKIDDESKKGPVGLVEGIFDLACAALQFGATLFQMGTILICVYTMSAIKENIEEWANFDMSSIDNFETAYHKMRAIFKLDDDSNTGLSGLVNNLLGLATALLGFGKTFFEMATILVGVMTMGLVYKNIQVWADFDQSIINNFETAYLAMRRIFKLDDDSNSGLSGLCGKLLGLASALLGFGKTFFEMATILVAVITMGQVYNNIQMWANFNKKIIQNFELAYSSLRRIFKLDDDSKKGVGDILGDIIGLATGLLKLGKTFFEMATILVAVITMGQVYENIQVWANFNKGIIKNFEDTYNALRRIFKLDDDKSEGISGIGSGLLGLASGMLKFGKTFFEMATVLVAVITMGHVYDNIQKWADFDKNTIKNFKYAYYELRRIFKFDDSSNKGVDGFTDGAFGLMSAALKFGKTFFEMGTILCATLVMKYVHGYLEPWKEFDSKSIDNFEDAYTRLRAIFKFDEPSGETLGGLSDNLFGMMGSLLGFGKTFWEMGSLLLTMWVMDKIREYTEPWSNFDLKSIDNLKIAVEGLEDIFGLNITGQKVEGMKSVGGGLLELGSAILDFGTTLFRMGALMIACYAMEKIAESLEKLGNISNLDTALSNLEKVVNKMMDVFGLTPPPPQEKKEEEGLWGSICSFGKAVVNAGSNLINAVGNVTGAIGDTAKIMALATAVGVMERIIDAIVKMTNIKDMSATVADFENAMDQIIYFFTDNQSDFIAAFYSIGFASNMVDKYVEMTERVADAEGDIVKFNELSTLVIDTLWNWQPTFFEPRVDSLCDVFRNQFKTFDERGENYRKNVSHTIALYKTLEKLERHWNGKKVSEPVGEIVDNLNRVELENVKALTDMFNAFSQVRETSIFSGFKNSVDDFVEACIRLVDAINGNTDALDSTTYDSGSNSNSNGSTTSSSGERRNKSTAVTITNVDELAQMISKKISTGRGGSSSAEVNLRINGISGEQWTIRKY